MGTFENTVVKAKQIIDATGAKIGNAIDIQKMNINLTKVKMDISDCYEQLGKLYYDGVKADKLDTEQMDDVIKQIELLNDNVRELEAEIAFAKGEVVCDECQTVNSSDSKFCRNCGREL